MKENISEFYWFVILRKYLPIIQLLAHWLWVVSYDHNIKQEISSNVSFEFFYLGYSLNFFSPKSGYIIVLKNNTSAMTAHQSITQLLWQLLS